MARTGVVERVSLTLVAQMRPLPPVGHPPNGFPLIPRSAGKVLIRDDLFRSRVLSAVVSRGPPVRLTGSIRFSSSWVTRYPRCCHQGSDFQATPAAFRLVPAVTACFPSALARASTDRTRTVPIPLP